MADMDHVPSAVRQLCSMKVRLRVLKEEQRSRRAKLLEERQRYREILKQEMMSMDKTKLKTGIFSAEGHEMVVVVKSCNSRRAIHVDMVKQAIASVLEALGGNPTDGSRDDPDDNPHDVQSMFFTKLNTLTSKKTSYADLVCIDDLSHCHLDDDDQLSATGEGLVGELLVNMDDIRRLDDTESHCEARNLAKTIDQVERDLLLTMSEEQKHKKDKSVISMDGGKYSIGIASTRRYPTLTSTKLSKDGKMQAIVEKLRTASSAGGTEATVEAIAQEFLGEMNNIKQRESTTTIGFRVTARAQK